MISPTRTGGDLDELYERHRRSLIEFAFLLTADRGLAEDLTQEAFVRLWRAGDRIRDDAATPAYLRTTVLNLLRTRLRRRLREIPHELIADAAAAGAEPAIDLLRALSKLPLRQRACVALRYLEDRSEADTAQLLGVSVGTVKSQTHKALARLRALLGDDDADV